MRKEIKIKQHDLTDCAAACVASVSAYYGLKLPMITVRDACGTRDDGTTVQGIIDGCSKIGMDSAGLKAREKTEESLKGAVKPLILHLKKKNGWLHFVVLYETCEKYATVMDPADGELHKVPYGELIEEWSGYVIAARPSATFVKGDMRTGTVSRFRELLSSSRKELVPVFLGTIAYICMNIGVSLFLQRIIDGILPDRDTVRLTVYGAALIAMALLCWITTYIRGVLLTRASLMMDCRLITGYFRKIFSLPVSFFDSRTAGDLNARVSDAYRIRAFITGRLILVAVSILTLAAALTVMFSFCWKLAIVSTAFIPPFIAIYAISERLNRKYNRKIIESNARFEETSIETLGSARAYIYCNATREASGKIEKDYAEMAGSLYRGGLANSMISAASDGIGRLMYAATLAVGAIFVLHGHLSIGELVSFLTVTSMVTSPVLLLVESNREITEAYISAERIFDIMDIGTENRKHLPGTIVLTGKETIRLQNVSFSFPGRKRLIKNLSCEFLPGKINLVKGANGSGKSTLASLLMKGYEPTEGRICLNGIDLSHIPASVWRKHIAMVPQKPDIFKGSILDNVVMGDRDYEIETVLASCIAAGMGKMLENLPDGILSQTGEQARNLSGGERQKIAIARALYRNAKVLILDEADTHLDVEGQELLEETVSLLKEHGITVILISHGEKRLQADNIIEM